MNKIRNCHSPAGMGYSMHGAKFVYLKDCPKCRFGTIDRKVSKDGKTVRWICADCNRVFTEEEIKTGVENGKGTK